MKTRSILIAHALMVFGIILLIIGSVASFYQEQQVFSGGISSVETVTPYRNVGMALVVAGILFMALGFLLDIFSPRETS